MVKRKGTKASKKKTVKKATKKKATKKLSERVVRKDGKDGGGGHR